MNFQIVQQVGGRKFIPALSQTNQPLIYPCPKKAAEAAAALTLLKGVKFQLRPVIEAANDWRGREQKRFDDGKYKPVIWIGQDWWDQHHKPDHFTHVSVKDPTRIAFVKDEKDGAADTQTSMKPGKYLAEFFGKVLTPDQVKAFAMQHSTTFETKELKFATTPEEIQRVYKPKLGCSCFSGTTKANLYGSGDFAVAYLEEGGKVTARAVCAPERKIYIHPYGDSERLDKLLKDAGYKHAYGGDKWRGLRLLKEWYWPGFYTDFGGGYPKPKLTDDKYFVI